MPELPEVETIKNEIAPAVLGRRFARVTVFDAKPIRTISPEQFCHGLIGRTVCKLERRGKYLLMGISAPAAGCPKPSDGVPVATLILHFKMSGALLVNPPEGRKYAKVLFELDDGTRLLFTDPRRFGNLWLVDDPEPIIRKLGPEPFSPDFTVVEFRRRLHGRQAPVKAILLDQTILAGVGNMYADEALFVSRIHPETPAGNLTPHRVQRLYEAIKQVLTAGIAGKGASTSDFIRPDGRPGAAHTGFNVAHRRGELCPACNGPIKRIEVRNRGTYFCPHCQKRR